MGGFKPTFRTRSGQFKEQSSWWIGYYVGGKLVSENSGTSVKSDAEKLLRARTAAVDQGRLVNPAALKATLDDLAAVVDADYRSNDRVRTREVARAYARPREHFGGDCLARTITPARIEQYKAARLGQKRRPATVNLELAMLRRRSGLPSAMASSPHVSAIAPAFRGPRASTGRTVSSRPDQRGGHRRPFRGFAE